MIVKKIPPPGGATMWKMPPDTTGVKNDPMHFRTIMMLPQCGDCYVQIPCTAVDAQPVQRSLKGVWTVYFTHEFNIEDGRLVESSLVQTISWGKQISCKLIFECHRIIVRLETVNITLHYTVRKIRVKVLLFSLCFLSKILFVCLKI